MYSVYVFCFYRSWISKMQYEWQNQNLSESHKLDSSRSNEALQVIGSFGNGMGRIRICWSWLIIRTKNMSRISSQTINRDKNMSRFHLELDSNCPECDEFMLQILSLTACLRILSTCHKYYYKNVCLTHDWHVRYIWFIKPACHTFFKTQILAHLKCWSKFLNVPNPVQTVNQYKFKSRI